MRLQNVSRTASAVGRIFAGPSSKTRVEPAQGAETAEPRRFAVLRRRLPDQQPDEPTERGTFLNIIV